MKRPLPVIPPSLEVLEQVREMAERRLTADEFDAYVHAPMSEAEREEILSSIAWFRRRYPTPGDRLAATRRACKRWLRAMRHE